MKDNGKMECWMVNAQYILKSLIFAKVNLQTISYVVREK